MPKLNKPFQLSAVLLLGAFCFAYSALPTSADTDGAVKALQRNDYATAMPLLKEAADSGDAYARVLLAQLLLNGKSGITDPEQASNGIAQPRHRIPRPANKLRSRNTTWLPFTRRAEVFRKMHLKPSNSTARPLRMETPTRAVS